VKALIDIAVPAITFALLAAVGLDLTAADFAKLRRQAAIVATGLLAPLVLLPPLAVVLIGLFRPDAATAAGLLLVASCPIGGISNTYSYLARASTALSITLTALSCLFAGLTIPLAGAGLEWIMGRHVDIVAPSAPLVVRLLLMLSLPVGLGMWVRSRAPAFATRHRSHLQRGAMAAIALILALVILESPHAFAMELGTTVPLAAAFVMCSMAAGWATSVPVTADRRDRFTLAAEFGTRNFAAATAIAVTMLGRIEFARFATTYFLTELPIMLVAIWLFRRSDPSTPRSTPRAARRPSTP
jgi:bile acid:Na+ symporter, BASS family